MPGQTKVVVRFAGDIEEEKPRVEAPNTQRDTRRIFEQRRKWPNACLRCSGEGGVSGFGADLGEDEIDETVCPSCLGVGKCPRCKADLPPDWQEKINGLYLAIQNGSQPPPPVRCGTCRWEDGDPPVLDLQEG